MNGAEVNRLASAGHDDPDAAVVISWGDHERLRLTLRNILDKAKEADDSSLRGYVLGITTPIRDELNRG